jgi:ectoine hydroxylase-related dioxygenase (phytanoyl-CoA dioxygenase family)
MYSANQSSAVADFNRRGYVVLREVFSPGEIALLRRAITTNDRMNASFQGVHEKFKSGKYPSFETIFVWNDTSGDDIFAKFTRSDKILRVLEQIFDDEVYVYHNKVALKYSDMPGFKYHQDYYYWYTMGCLYPDMGTCYIAIDEATRRNGCLKFVEGSHRLGRIDHVLFDGVSDSSVDPDRLAAIMDLMPERHMELAPGDAVIFHSNTLHGSDANLSPDSRLALLGCYNTRHNNPYRTDGDHPMFVKQTHIHDRVVEADLARMPDFNLTYSTKR